MTYARNFIEGDIVYNSLFVCKDCKKTMTAKYHKTWFALQCDCKHAIYYASGHFTVIPKKVYLKNKENEQLQRN